MTKNFKICCDICGKNKKYEKNGEPNIFHFSGDLGEGGKFSAHIHVCKKCCYKYGYNVLFLNVSNLSAAKIGQQCLPT